MGLPITISAVFQIDPANHNPQYFTPPQEQRDPLPPPPATHADIQNLHGAVDRMRNKVESAIDDASRAFSAVNTLKVHVDAATKEWKRIQAAADKLVMEMHTRTDAMAVTVRNARTDVDNLRNYLKPLDGELKRIETKADNKLSHVEKMLRNLINEWAAKIPDRESLQHIVDDLLIRIIALEAKPKRRPRPTKKRKPRRSE